MNPMRGGASKGTRDNSDNIKENTFISNQYANASVVQDLNYISGGES